MRAPWKNVLLAVACVGVLVFLWMRGCQRAEEPDVIDVEDAQPSDVRVPLPPLPDPVPAHERARGTYVLDAEGLRVSLELLEGSRFRFLATRPGERRSAEGTWSLTGRRLVLAYRRVNGHELAEPITEANEWHGRSIALGNTGIAGPVILVKRTMIRER